MAKAMFKHFAASAWTDVLAFFSRRADLAARGPTHLQKRVDAIDMSEALSD